MKEIGLAYFWEFVDFRNLISLIATCCFIHFLIWLSCDICPFWRILFILSTTLWFYVSFSWCSLLPFWGLEDLYDFLFISALGNWCILSFPLSVLLEGCQFDRSSKNRGFVPGDFLYFVCSLSDTRPWPRDLWGGSALWGEGMRSDLSRVSVYRIVPSLVSRVGFSQEAQSCCWPLTTHWSAAFTCSQIKPCMPLQSHVSISVTPRPSLYPPQELLQLLLLSNLILFDKRLMVLSKMNWVCVLLLSEWNRWAAGELLEPDCTHLRERPVADPWAMSLRSCCPGFEVKDLERDHGLYQGAGTHGHQGCPH